jgi:L-serine dehydratase
MGDGTHIVSLDDAIKAMKQTGNDMKDHYKETSKGGLAIAVSQPAC